MVRRFCEKRSGENKQMNRILVACVFAGISIPVSGQAPLPAPAPSPAPAAAPLPPRPPAGFDYADVDVDVDMVRSKIETTVRPALDSMRGEMDRVRYGLETMRNDFAFKFEPMPFFAQSVKPVPPAPPAPPEAVRWVAKGIRSRDSEERMYRRGSEFLDRREWEKAVEAFDAVTEYKGTKADGALYWKAYAFAKLGKRDQALAALGELQKSYASSRWVNDAKALEVEVKQANGQPLSPETEDDEDLKLLAINSLIASDPERAIPLLEKILQSRNAPKLKERALFVLAQSKNPKAQEIVVRYAKGSGNPDLQVRAVEYLGIYGGKDNAQTLAEVYTSSSDASLKRSVLHSFYRAKDKDRLLTAARSEQNQNLKAEAIRLLGNIGSIAEVSQFYTPDASAEVKSAVLDSLYSANAADRMIELAKNEKDARVRSEVIHRLGAMRRTKTSDALVQMYGADTDRDSKRAIMQALYSQGSAKELVDVAKKEADPELRRQAVRMLSNMKSKEASDFLAELLNK